MKFNRFLMGAAALVPRLGLVSGLALAAPAAQAKPTDYRFELAGKPEPSANKAIVRIRLAHLPDGKPVTDAMIFETRADMGPAGMETMTAPMRALPANGGIYSFEIEPGMTGTWALHLAAKVQGEPETVRGSVNADLVK